MNALLACLKCIKCIDSCFWKITGGVVRLLLFIVSYFFLKSSEVQPRAVACLTVPDGHQFHCPHSFLKFWSFYRIIPQIFLISSLSFLRGYATSSNPFQSFNLLIFPSIDKFVWLFDEITITSHKAVNCTWWCSCWLPPTESRLLWANQLVHCKVCLW